MKKIMFATAVAAAGLAFGIDSANTVGYTTRDINNKFVISAGQFDAVGGDAFSVSKVTVSAPASVAAWQNDVDMDDDGYWELNTGWEDQAAQIQIPNANGVGYTIAYYISDARDPDSAENLGAGWADPSGYMINATVPVGVGVWLNARKSVNLPINK